MININGLIIKSTYVGFVFELKKIVGSWSVCMLFQIASIQRRSQLRSYKSTSGAIMVAGE